MQKQQNNEEYELDLGNFSDFEEQTDLDACGGDSRYKLEKKQTTDKSSCTNPECGTSDACGHEQQRQAEPVVKAEAIPVAKQCRKCKEKKAVLKLRGDKCCRECYMAALDHKFRSGLRTNLNIGKSDLILLALSGGPNSIAMIKLVSECLFNPKTRKMFFKAQVLYIDEGVIYKFENERRLENIKKMRDFAAECQLELNVVKLEDIYSLKSESITSKFLSKVTGKEEDAKEPEPSDTSQSSVIYSSSNTNQFSTENAERLHNMLNSLSDSGSSREDVLFQFKQYLLLDFAARCKATKVALGDSAQKIAVKSLSQICKGRGASLLNEVGVVDQKFSDLELTRPLNDFLTKEVLLYNNHLKLEKWLLLNPSLTETANNKKMKNIPAKGNIDHLLEGFVTKLQSGFPSTVHTVLNTLGKLRDKRNLEALCPLCMGKKDRLINVLEKGSIIEHLKEGQQDTTSGPQGFLDSAKECELTKKNYLSSAFYEDKSMIEKVCCFGCGRTFENAKDPASFVDNLPDALKNNAQISVSNCYAKLNTDKDLKDYVFYEDEDEFY